MGNNVSLEVPKLLGELATMVAMQVNEIAREFGCETGSTYVIKKGGSAGQDSGTYGKFLEQCVSIRERVGRQNNAEGKATVANGMNKIPTVKTIKCPVKVGQEAGSG